LICPRDSFAWRYPLEISRLKQFLRYSYVTISIWFWFCAHVILVQW
jgi:hypothetical protein